MPRLHSRFPPLPAVGRPSRRSIANEGTKCSSRWCRPQPLGCRRTANIRVAFPDCETNAKDCVRMLQPSIRRREAESASTRADRPDAAGASATFAFLNAAQPEPALQLAPLGLARVLAEPRRPRGAPCAKAPRRRRPPRDPANRGTGRQKFRTSRRPADRTRGVNAQVRAAATARFKGQSQSQIRRVIGASSNRSAPARPRGASSITARPSAPRPIRYQAPYSAKSARSAK